MDNERVGEFAREYSDKRFVKKLRLYSQVAGNEVLDKAFRLYFVLHKPETPKWVKGTIVGALGYFIFPFDAVSDFLPLIGYSDDLSVLVAALAMVSRYVDDEVRAKAKSAAERWISRPKDQVASEDPIIIDVEGEGPKR